MVWRARAVVLTSRSSLFGGRLRVHLRACMQHSLGVSWAQSVTRLLVVVSEGKAT